MGKTFSNTILLVEDDLFLRASMFEMLRHFGCTIYTAKDGEEALFFFQKYVDEIDLVLIESYLPGFDTEETVVAMHSINPDILAIILTPANCDMGGYRDLPGVCGHISKPFDVCEVAKGIILYVLGERERMYSHRNVPRCYSISKTMGS